MDRTRFGCHSAIIFALYTDRHCRLDLWGTASGVLNLNLVGKFAHGAEKLSTPSCFEGCDPQAGPGFDFPVTAFRLVRLSLFRLEFFRLRLFRLVFVVLAVGAVFEATGKQGSSWLVSFARAEMTQKISFDIPAQSLESALDAYSAISRVQVLYEAALAVGRHSDGVRGVLVPDVALKLLLAGTGLDFDYTTERAITLVPVKQPNIRAGAEAERLRHIAQFDRFLGGLQAGILSTLCRHPEARPGGFEVAMRFWVTGSGAIVSPLLLASTGKPMRDRAILGVLSRLSFNEPPPPEMPQPITMMLTGKASLRDGDACAEAAKE